MEIDKCTQSTAGSLIPHNKVQCQLSILILILKLNKSNCAQSGKRSYLKIKLIGRLYGVIFSVHQKTLNHQLIHFKFCNRLYCTLKRSICSLNYLQIPSEDFVLINKCEHLCGNVKGFMSFGRRLHLHCLIYIGQKSQCNQLLYFLITSTSNFGLTERQRKIWLADQKSAEKIMCKDGFLIFYLCDTTSFMTQ